MTYKQYLRLSQSERREFISNMNNKEVLKFGRNLLRANRALNYYFNNDQMRVFMKQHCKKALFADVKQHTQYGLSFSFKMIKTGNYYLTIKIDGLQCRSHYYRQKWNKKDVIDFVKYDFPSLKKIDYAEIQ